MYQNIFFSILDDPEFSSLDSDSERRNPVVFFKVVKIDGPDVLLPCYICDSSSTRLVQVADYVCLPSLSGNKPVMAISPLFIAFSKF